MSEKQAVKPRTRKSAKPVPVAAPVVEELVDDDINASEGHKAENDPGVATGEESVRRYIQFLSDPASMVDEGEAERIEEEIALSHDVIEKVRLIAKLTRVRTPDGSDVLADFLRDARGWSTANNVPASAFRSMGVSEDVLRRAGLVRVGRKAPRQGSRQKSSRVTVADIQQWVMSRNEAFTVRDVHESLGASLVTSMKAIRQMIDQGNVIELGQGEGEGRPGRSPGRYLRLLE